MQSFALKTTGQVEIVSAYSASNQQIPAVASEPGWFIIGAFQIPVDSDAKLEAIGSVSNGSLTMSLRLFDMTDGAPVSGSTLSITSQVDVRERSGQISLQSGRVYQMQAEVIGGTGDSLFGTIRSATLV